MPRSGKSPLGSPLFNDKYYVRTYRLLSVSLTCNKGSSRRFTVESNDLAAEQESEVQPYCNRLPDKKSRIITRAKDYDGGNSKAWLKGDRLTVKWDMLELAALISPTARNPYLLLEVGRRDALEKW
jgi:hypothetical protein